MGKYPAPFGVGVKDASILAVTAENGLVSGFFAPERGPFDTAPSESMINWSPDEDQLRRFGWRGVAAFPLAAVVLAWLLPEADVLGIAVVFGFLAVAFALFAWRAPARLKPIYLLVMVCRSVILSPAVLVRRIFGGKDEKLPDDGNSDSP